jgi:hypothetical protein
MQGARVTTVEGKASARFKAVDSPPHLTPSPLRPRVALPALLQDIFSEQLPLDVVASSIQQRHSGSAAHRTTEIPPLNKPVSQAIPSSILPRTWAVKVQVRNLFL